MDSRDDDEAVDELEADELEETEAGEPEADEDSDALADSDDDDEDDSDYEDSDDDENSDYEDSDDDEHDDSDDDDEPGAVTAAPRRMGPTLLVLGGGVWAIAAALRCGAPDVPSASLSPDATTPEPAVVRAADEPDDEPIIEDKPDGEPIADDEAEPEPAAAGAALPDGADEAELEDEAPPEPIPEDWATDPSPPDKVTYTIRHGGSIKNVANLFKIYHHEITALNPGIALERELPPNSKVVVYLQEDGVSSESVGIPSGGSLEGGVPMVEGPGRHLKAIPWKSFGTAHTVALLDQVLRQWAARGKVQPVLVGNMSSRKGGRLEPHSTHQSGRDVDLGYLQKLPEGEELNWRSMTKDNLDAEETWNLLRLLRSTGQVEVVFIDTSIQKLLYEHAVAKGMSKSELSRWLEYPRSPPQRRAIVQHVKGHVDHMHVRFECQSHESRCRSRDR